MCTHALRGRDILLVILLSALLPLACERSAPPAAADRSGKKELTVDELEWRLWELNQKIEKEPDSVATLIERGHIQRRLAQFVAEDRVWTLYQGAWDDYRSAHELCGGTWDFPNPLDALVAARRGEAPPQPPIFGEKGKGGSVDALIGAYALCGRLYQMEIAAQLLRRAAKLDPNNPAVVARMIHLRALEDENWDRALLELRKLEDNPVLKEADYYWFAVAFAAQQVGDLESAATAYRRAMELSDDPAGPRSNLIGVLAQMGKGEEAAALMKQAGAVNLNDLFAHNNYADHLVCERRYAEAVAILQPVMDRNPGFPMGWMNLGRAYRGLREHERAIQALRNATRLVPQFLAAWRELAWAYADAGRTDDALAAYRVALMQAPEDADAQIQFARLLAYVGRREDAEQAYREGLRLKPDDVQAWVGLGKLLLQQKRHSDARAALSKAIELDPNSALAQRSMGDLEMAEDHAEAAADWFRKVLQQYPYDQETFWAMCTALLAQSKSDEALLLIDRELERRPDTPALYSCRATVRFHRGELDEAEADYTRGQELRASSEGRRMRGLIRLLRGRLDAAADDLRASLELGSTDRYSALLLWVVEREAGRAEAADRVLKESGSNADPNHWSGRVLRCVADGASADELLAAAADDGQRCEAYYYLGERAHAAGQFAVARDWFEKCVATRKEGFAEYRLAQWRLAQPSLQVVERPGTSYRP